MIHQVFLPEITRKRLTDVVALQMLLLTYAAYRDTLNEASCTTYLDRCARFRGRGSQIASWIWHAPGRYEPLAKFAEGPTAQKFGLSKCITREAFAFLRNPIGNIQPYIGIVSSSWESAGANFLRRFYDDLCSDSGLPGCLFSESGAGSFGRQDLLAAFMETNRNLQVCAVCDESDYRSMLNGRIYAELDHYLPKSVYPHLACHPFNLIPICHFCNSSLKGSADPLRQGSGTYLCVEDIFLPYREAGLGSRTYLQVQLGEVLHRAEFGVLKFRESSDIRDTLDVFRRVYKIPDRWSGRVDFIGERLFKRMREFLRSVPNVAIRPRFLLNSLDDLLHTLHQEQGAEPFAFAKMWWLAALINEEVEPATRRRAPGAVPTFPLIEELAAMLQLDKAAGYHRPERPIKMRADRLETARSLRKIAQGTS